MIAVFKEASDIKTNYEFVTVVKGDTAKILDLQWSSDNSFYTFGLRHAKSWTLRNTTLSGKRMSFGKGGDKLVASSSFQKNKCLVGSTKGEL